MAKKGSVLRYLISAATVLLLLAWQCLDVYITGNRPANLDGYGLHIENVYRAEDVGLRLRSIGIWAIVYVLLLAAGALWLSDRKPDLPGMEPDNRLRLMKKRLRALPKEAQSQENCRKRVRLCALAAVLLCAAMGLSYLLNREHFMSWDLETVMGDMLMHTVPWVAAAFAVLVGAAFLCRRSMEKEIALLKGLAADAAPEVPKETESLLPIIRVCLFAGAVVLVVLGIRNGGMRDVLVKAINICTECIGLG